MSEATFTAGGATYAVMRMDPRAQLLMLKRLMRFVPALTGSDKILARIRAGQAVEAEDALDMLAELAPIVADTPDGDLDFISDTCLGATKQRTPEGRWVPVRTAEGSVSNMDNDAVVRKLLIVANVLRVTFAPMLAEIAPAIGGLPGDAQPDPRLQRGVRRPRRLCEVAAGEVVRPRQGFGATAEDRSRGRAGPGQAVQGRR